jgi:transposase-like protein
MNYEEVLSLAKLLSKEEQLQLIVSLSPSGQEDTGALRSRCAALINKQLPCPHCGGKHYRRYGKAHGSQRFRCNDCKRTFTEYTGTWLDGIHKKSLAEPYISLMIEEYSLDKIRDKLHINKKTAFDWRHKILSSYEQNTGDEFEGVVESDETFFDHSEKGNRHLQRPPRRRGRDPKKRGISADKAAVIVSKDRSKSLKMTVSTMGRITKSDIKESFQNPLPEESILCSDGHVSYKGYSIDHNLKHIVLRADLKQYVKKGGYHIQHVNELHNRLKKWIAGSFWGVSTKYLQNYLNWFYMREKFKHESITTEKMALASIQNAHAIKQYRCNNFSYNVLIATRL